MIRTKFTIITLAFFLSAANLIAEPVANSFSSDPEPVRGMQYLEDQTFYPLLERELGIEADVVLSFQVDRLGNVSNIIVTQSGGSLFNESAIDAVVNTEWNPAMQNGNSIAVTFELPFEFRSN